MNDKNIIIYLLLLIYIININAQDDECFPPTDIVYSKEYCDDVEKNFNKKLSDCNKEECCENDVETINKDCKYKRENYEFQKNCKIDIYVKCDSYTPISSGKYCGLDDCNKNISGYERCKKFNGNIDMWNHELNEHC